MVDSSTKASHTPQQAIVDCPNTPRATSQPTPLQDFRHGEGVGVIVDHDFCCGLVAADAHHLPWPTLSITALLIWPHCLWHHHFAGIELFSDQGVGALTVG